MQLSQLWSCCIHAFRERHQSTLVKHPFCFSASCSITKQRHHAMPSDLSWLRMWPGNSALCQLESVNKGSWRLSLVVRLARKIKMGPDKSTTRHPLPEYLNTQTERNTPAPGIKYSWGG